ncbi:MAG: alpha/beta fold hydrolase [Tepidiformaceae bacterium]
MNASDIEVAHGAFRVQAWRDGSGPGLLFLHGFEGHPGDAAFLQRFARTRSVVAPEHPGFGDSVGFDHIDDILDMTLYYRQLIEGVADGPLDVVGHSLGGMFAAEIAAVCPQLVRRLVLVSPFGLWLDETPIPDLFVMSPGQLQRAMWSDPESHASQQALSSSTNGKSGPAAIVARASNLSAAGKFLWPIPDRGLGKRLPLIKAQTLIIAGADDGLVPPRYAEEFGSLIPGARRVVVEGAGHFPMLEQPDEFHRLVDAFLAS